MKNRKNIGFDSRPEHFDKTTNNKDSELFSDDLLHLASSLARFMSIEHANLQFKEAALHVPAKNCKDQRWFISYYPISSDTDKPIHKRDYLINKIADLKQRKIVAMSRIRKYNLLLSKGKKFTKGEVYLTEEKREQPSKLVDAVAMIIQSKQKHRPHTAKDYLQLQIRFLDFLKKKNWHNMYLEQFTYEHASAYCNYLVIERNYSPRSHNNHRNNLLTIWNELIKLNKSQTNPFKEVPKLPQGIGRNIAYTEEQREIIYTLCRIVLPEMEQIIKIIAQTFIRINELCLVKISHIDLANRLLYIPKENSKNAQERFVELTDQCIEAMLILGVHKSHPDNYLISRDLVPGPNKYNPNKLSDRYRVNIMSKLNLGKDYTLYSWKHTGVVVAKKSGMPDYQIEKQGGWKDRRSYQQYLKSLSLERNTGFNEAMPRV